MSKDRDKPGPQLSPLAETGQSPQDHPLLDLFQDVPFGGMFSHIHLEIRIYRIRKEMVERLERAGLDTSGVPKILWP